MSKTKTESSNFVIGNFYGNLSEEKGRLKNKTYYPLELLNEIIAEAISYGYDIQYVHPKGDGSPVLWFSTNGFKQR